MCIFSLVSELISAGAHPGRGLLPLLKKGGINADTQHSCLLAFPCPRSRSALDKWQFATYPNLQRFFCLIGGVITGSICNHELSLVLQTSDVMLSQTTLYKYSACVCHVAPLKLGQYHQYSYCILKFFDARFIIMSMFSCTCSHMCMRVVNGFISSSTQHLPPVS